jgi:hypothetical protein
MLKEKYGEITDREWNIFYEGVAFGHRNTANIVNQKLLKLNFHPNEAVMRIFFRDMKRYLYSIIDINNESAMKLHKDNEELN